MKILGPAFLCLIFAEQCRENVWLLKTEMALNRLSSLTFEQWHLFKSFHNSAFTISSISQLVRKYWRSPLSTFFNCFLKLEFLYLKSQVGESNIEVPSKLSSLDCCFCMESSNLTIIMLHRSMEERQNLVLQIKIWWLLGLLFQAISLLFFIQLNWC